MADASGRRGQARSASCNGSEQVAKLSLGPEPVLFRCIILAAPVLPMKICQTGDGFLIQRRFNDPTVRHAFCLTTPAFHVYILFLRLHNASFGFVSHFTIFKSNTAML